jgi:hypothetical protein
VLSLSPAHFWASNWTPPRLLSPKTFPAYHHHHQFLLSLRGHRASTKHRHLVPFLAILLTSLQLFPFSIASLWTDLRHVRLGLPLLLFPCGFQSKASLSMASFPFLSVCPTQSHFCLLICVGTSVSSVLLQTSSCEITSGQWMFRILHKQRLTKVCSLEMVVFISFHVSDSQPIAPPQNSKLSSQSY